MSLKQGFQKILTSYPSALGEPFAKHQLAHFIRQELPNQVRSFIKGQDKYIVKGSAGQGNWAQCPWIGIFNKLVTTTAQEGYYLVYLFKEDFSGLYLSLNQGVTDVRIQYGINARKALKVRAANYLAKLGSQVPQSEQGTIDLAAQETSSLGSFYQAGSICSIYYEAGKIPSDDVLKEDFYRYLGLYEQLDEKEVFFSSQAEEDEPEMLTEKAQLRFHKRTERNQKLAKKAKEHHGYVCQACGFDFVAVYGVIGEGFIEAHHLTPIAELKGKAVNLDPKTDFAVLCSNCHRMIHKSNHVGSIEQFREVHLRKK